MLACSLSFGPCRAPSLGVPGGLLVFAAESGGLREEIFHDALRHRLHLFSRTVSYQNRCAWSIGFWDAPAVVGVVGIRVADGVVVVAVSFFVVVLVTAGGPQQ